MTPQAPDTAQTPAPDDLFARAARHLIDAEGGYVDDPADPGGETKFGISKRQYPQLRIATLTYDQALAIYRTDYWGHYQCAELPPALGVFLFDAVVNHQPKVAVRFVQQALRITADGIIGPITLRAARQAAALSSYAEVIAMAFAYRTDFYHDLVNANPRQERFLLGWFKRLFRLQQFLATLEAAA
ncbi:MAG: glycoside hydrolase family 108 protein [Pseudomonadota bacterium]